MGMAKKEFKDIHKRFGMFRLNKTLIDKEPLLVLSIMSNMIVISALPQLKTGIIEYQALSPLFETIDYRDKIPQYSISVEDGEVKAKKIEIKKIIVPGLVVPEGVANA